MSVENKSSKITDPKAKDSKIELSKKKESEISHSDKGFEQHSVMPPEYERIFQARLDERKLQHRFRQRKILTSAQGAHVSVLTPMVSHLDPSKQEKNTGIINFSSNDYLGLAKHPKLIEAFRQAASEYGVGSGASHLVCGHSNEHHKLEEELAEFTGRDRALLFSTGYMANMGVMNALLEKPDAIFQDKLNHASLLDGGLNSSAKFIRYAHNDMEHLDQRLANTSARLKMIASDGVFSMDGDEAPLKTLNLLAEKHNALLMIDDAHGFGALGSNGAGLIDQETMDQDAVPIYMGTLGKAIGCSGAFVCGSDALIETLVQFARTYIYTTAIPPAIAAANRCALRLLNEDKWRREGLTTHISHFKRGCAELGLSLLPSNTAIQPLVIGDEQLAITLSQALLDKGFWVSAIRPPTVPRGTARLRFTLSADHSEKDLDQLLNALDELRSVSPLCFPQNI